MLHLPPYADNKIGRACLAEIVANPPETAIRRSDWGNTEYYRGWKRPDVAMLNRLHREWWDANHEGATGLPESPDALIKRALAETADQRAAA